MSLEIFFDFCVLKYSRRERKDQCSMRHYRKLTRKKQTFVAVRYFTEKVIAFTGRLLTLKYNHSEQLIVIILS